MNKIYSRKSEVNIPLKEFSIEEIFFSLKSVSYKAESVRPFTIQG